MALGGGVGCGTIAAENSCGVSCFTGGLVSADCGALVEAGGGSAMADVATKQVVRSIVPIVLRIRALIAIDLSEIRACKSDAAGLDWLVGHELRRGTRCP